MVLPVLFPETRIPCTACGRPLIAAGVLASKPDVKLCCSGCGRWGVYCQCKPQEGAR